LADSAAWLIGAINPMARQFGFRSVGAEEIAMLRGQSSREILRYLRVPLWRLPAIARHARELSARDADAIPLFPGAAELLSRLDAAGVRLAIVSSNAEETIRRVLGPELSATFCHFGCGTSIFGKAAKLRAAVRHAGVSREATLCIGDETRDIEAARKAGLPCVAVTWGYATEAALRRAGPDRTVGSLADLEALLLGEAHARPAAG
jgi:phosphoglycolate phosphatase